MAEKEPWRLDPTIVWLSSAIIRGDKETAIQAANKALAQGFDAFDIMQKGAALAMDVVSYLYDQKIYYLPEALVAANAFYGAADVLQPHIKPGEGGPKIKVLIGVIEGDIHDIGKNLVKVRAGATGYTIIDLGRDVPLDKIIEEAEKNQVDVIALSTMMTPTMLGFEAVIEMLKEQGKRDKFLVTIGGGPVTEEFAKKIGADGYGESASEASRMFAKVKAEKDKLGKLPAQRGMVVRG